MIIDLILDRFNGSNYSAKSFYNYLMQDTKTDVFARCISRAMDFEDEKTVQKMLTDLENQNKTSYNKSIKIKDGNKMKNYIYVVERESKNYNESVCYCSTLQEASEDALNYYQGLSRYDQKGCEVWVYEYPVEEELIGKGVKETYFKICDYDFEELGFLRDSTKALKLNEIESKLNDGYVTISDRFGNSFNFSLSADSFLEDEYETIDHLYDEIENNLVADKETIRASRYMIDVEEIIESEF